MHHASAAAEDGRSKKGANPPHIGSCISSERLGILGLRNTIRLLDPKLGCPTSTTTLTRDDGGENGETPEVPPS